MRLALSREWAVGVRIGDGGFGAVFDAENTDGEKAAVKLVPKAPGTEREMLFTDLDGVRNVVPVIDSGEHEDQWVLVMPRAEKSLRDHLKEHGQRPLSEVVAVLSDVVEALADRGAPKFSDSGPHRIEVQNGGESTWHSCVGSSVLSFGKRRSRWWSWSPARSPRSPERYK
ncbi:hypothetical protein [Streptomyces sp. H27-C3]|uniref:hypothetical protein n=1 Tax=Streptomyces sp. H27-C3 TaxID=3046305 RepID=UPI0024BA3A60|nr:hypothetical protein [Streptomyces sp. H27-C3]MDJ0466658.1 hypothetical protein [Streptomyces sp. H27-C3]